MARKRGDGLQPIGMLIETSCMKHGTGGLMMYKKEIDAEKDITDENVCLKKENTTMQEIIKNKEIEIARLRERIRFQEGQIDAYQYCMNCRRGL